MSDSFRSVPDPVARFFDNYLICLAKASVPEKQRRWTIKRVEAFIKTHSGHKIKSLTSQEVSGYLEMLGCENRLLGRQFGQCVHAIRILPRVFLSRQITQHTIDCTINAECSGVNSSDYYLSPTPL